VNKALLILFTSVTFALAHVSHATEPNSKIQNAFGDQKAQINDFDSQLKEVVVDSKVYFATHDGRYLFAGPILDTEQGVDIVAARQNLARQAYLNEIPNDVFINYASSDAHKHTVTVFTDIDCPYCRKLHAHMQRFNQRGISINYVMVPRAGTNSKSYHKVRAALCSDDPAQTITRAMQNVQPKPSDCEISVLAQHLEIAQAMQITSTPTIVLPDGQLQLGLVNPDQLIALLGEGE